jgi:hypothetical protein
VSSATYVWQATVSTGCDFGLVGVDEYPGVAGRATAAITSNDFAVCPLDRLLVDKLNGCSWLRLWKC